jgi:hypothetical protein
VDLDRRVAQALIPGNPHILGTGGIYGARRLAALAPQDEDTRFLIEAWRLMREGQDLNRQEAAMEERFRILRVRHMIGDLTEEAWKTSLQRAEKDVNFTRSVRQVRDVYVGAVRDLVRQVLTDGHDKKEIRRQVQELMDYCNQSYDGVSKRFGRITPHITVKLTR